MIKELVERSTVEKRKKKEKTSIYVTDNSACARQMFYGLTNTPESNPNDYMSCFKMEMGEIIENYLLEKLGEAVEDRQIKIEIPLEGSKWELHGKCDALLKLKDKRCLLEIKSYAGYPQTKQLEAGMAKESYVIQLALYIFFLKDMIKDLSSTGFLLYQNREDGTMYEFEVRVDDAGLIYVDNKPYGGVNMWLDRLTKVGADITAGKEPEREFNSTHWLCREKNGYCNYRSLCWGRI